MLSGSLGNNAPTLHGVALLAARTHLPAVDVRVTISAVGPDIGEDRLGVALRTGDPLMQAAQRIFCCVVIEFRNGPNGFPTHGRVAVLAGDAQAAVRTARYRPRGLTNPARHKRTHRQPQASGDNPQFRK